MDLARMAEGLKILKRIEDDRKKYRVFDLRTWGQLPKKESERKRHPDLSCATAACAVGSMLLAGTIRGLNFEVEEDGSMTPIFGPKGEKDYGFDAVCKAFGLDHDAARFLFDPEQYRLKKGKNALQEVIKRMEVMMALHAAQVCAF